MVAVVHRALRVPSLAGGGCGGRPAVRRAPLTPVAPAAVAPQPRYRSSHSPCCQSHCSPGSCATAEDGCPPA
eukprot:11161283-Lingulodinium_polyedra.AAC.1